MHIFKWPSSTCIMLHDFNKPQISFPHQLFHTGMLIFHALTYLSILHPHKPCGLPIYPWGRPLQSGAVVPHREEPTGNNSCWPKEKNQENIVCMSGCDCECLQDLQAVKEKSPNTSLARAGWAEPGIISRLTNQCWVLGMPHSRTIHFPQGTWLNVLNLSVFVETKN